MHPSDDFCAELTEWKQTPHSVLELSGTGLSGNHGAIRQFTEENFGIIIIINLCRLDGRQFMECYHAAAGLSTVSGFPRSKNPLRDALRMFCPNFEDTEDTLVILEQIRQSAELKFQIRQLAKQLRCRFLLI